MSNLLYNPSSGLTFNNYTYPRFSAPLDPRSVVLLKSNLTQIASDFPYRGMLVVVIGDTDENNGAYYLSTTDSTNINNWKKISGNIEFNFQWPDAPEDYDPSKAYYLKFAKDNNNEISPYWEELTSSESFRLGIEDMYAKTGETYTISDGSKTVLSNIYSEDNENKTADVVAVHNEEDSFYLMFNPALEFTIDGGDSEARLRVTITIPSTINSSIYEISSSTPLGINWLYNNNMVSSDPTDALITWYSDAECQTAVGTVNTSSHTENPISGDTEIYTAGSTLTRYAIGRKDNYDDSFISQVDMSVYDDTININISVHTNRTNSNQVNITDSNN